MKKNKIFRAIFFALATVCGLIALIYAIAVVSVADPYPPLANFLGGIGIAAASIFASFVLAKIGFIFDRKVKVEEAAIAAAEEDKILWEEARVRVRNNLKKYTSGK